MLTVILKGNVILAYMYFFPLSFCLVMILGVLLAKKKYPLIKYMCVLLIVCGVALFMYKEVRYVRMLF